MHERERRELRVIMDRHPDRVPVLHQAIREGKINGHVWDTWLEGHRSLPVSGCVYGHMSGMTMVYQQADESYGQAGRDLVHAVYLETGTMLLENFVMDVRTCQTPAESPVLAQLLAWVEEWMRCNSAEQTLVAV